MLHEDQDKKIKHGWGDVVDEYFNEDGKKVRLYENGCSTVGEPNLDALRAIAVSIRDWLLSLDDDEYERVMFGSHEDEMQCAANESKGKGTIELCYRS
ncbi:hypothetical protein ACFLXI_04275 [Chloroflexota bacterium]